MSLSDFDYDNKHNITEKVSESMTDNLQFCGVSVSQPGLCTTVCVYIYLYMYILNLYTDTVSARLMIGCYM